MNELYHAVLVLWILHGIII